MEVIIKLVLGLGAIVITLVVMARLLPRLAGAQPGGDAVLSIVSALPVGPRERLIVLQVGAEQVLLGVTPGAVTTLHVLPKPVEAAASQPQPAAKLPAHGWLQRLLWR